MGGPGAAATPLAAAPARLAPPRPNRRPPTATPPPQIVPPQAPTTLVAAPPNASDNAPGGRRTHCATACPPASHPGATVPVRLYRNCRAA
eukprot:11210364-Lingulodinium_polyedra.AAC.1